MKRSALICDPFNRGAVHEYYGAENERAVTRRLTYLDKHIRNFISISPFAVIASTDSRGRCDAYPRVDQPGFVAVLDEKTLLIPDREDNNRIDTFKNVIGAAGRRDRDSVAVSDCPSQIRTVRSSDRRDNSVPAEKPDEVELTTTFMPLIDAAPKAIATSCSSAIGRGADDGEEPNVVARGSRATKKRGDTRPPNAAPLSSSLCEECKRTMSARER